MAWPKLGVKHAPGNSPPPSREERVDLHDSGRNAEIQRASRTAKHVSHTFDVPTSHSQPSSSKRYWLLRTDVASAHLHLRRPTRICDALPISFSAFSSIMRGPYNTSAIVESERIESRVQ